MNIKEYLIGLILSIPGLILALSMHEFAHGFAASKMGDNTAKYNGRLSINPLAHLDPLGTICLFLFHFGWAKPVPINPNNFENRKKGIIIVSLAGPFMNFLIAFVSAILMNIIKRFANASEIAVFFYYLLYYSEVLNIGLMVFNLIPLPPLDGSKVLLELLPYRFRDFYYRYERYSQFILLLLIVTRSLNPILSTLCTSVNSFINLIMGLIF